MILVWRRDNSKSTVSSFLFGFHSENVGCICKIQLWHNGIAGNHAGLGRAACGYRHAQPRAAWIPKVPKVQPEIPITVATVPAVAHRNTAPRDITGLEEEAKSRSTVFSGSSIGECRPTGKPMMPLGSLSRQHRRRFCEIWGCVWVSSEVGPWC